MSKILAAFNSFSPELGLDCVAPMYMLNKYNNKIELKVKFNYVN